MIMKKAILFLMLTFCAGIFSQAIAQDNEPEGFIFLKSIDQVDIYYKQMFCDNNVEYLVIEAINQSTSSVSLYLQPIFKSDNTSFSSKAPIILTLSGGDKITGDCNTSNLQASVFEFFSQYDPTLMTFDLTKI